MLWEGDLSEQPHPPSASGQLPTDRRTSCDHLTVSPSRFGTPQGNRPQPKEGQTLLPASRLFAPGPNRRAVVRALLFGAKMGWGVEPPKECRGHGRRVFLVLNPI